MTVHFNVLNMYHFNYYLCFPFFLFLLL